MQRSPLHYLMLDFEDTGLDPHLDQIIEVGVIGTTANLEPLFELETMVQPQPSTFARLEATPAAKAMHVKSGLLDDLTRTAEAHLLPSLADVETYLVAKIDEFAVPGQEVILAGAGISHHDMALIQAQMPVLLSRLAYHMFDTGDARRQYQTATGQPLSPLNDQKTHRAFEDVLCCLGEARLIFNLYRTGTTGVAAA